MGGAFIGVADDATAASWNPAGLVQLEKPEVSIAYSSMNRNQKYSSDIHPEIATDNSMAAAGINYASVAYPFALFKKNMIVSVNYQRLYELKKDIAFNYTWDLSGDLLHDTIKFNQEGFLYALSPAYSVQVTPRLSLGVTANLWGDYLGRNGWESTYVSHATGTMFSQPYEVRVDRQDDVSFSGTNQNVGLLWNVAGPMTIGVVYKTAFDAHLTKKSRFSSSQALTGTPLHTESVDETTEKLTMKMPSSYGLGLSYRHSDAWTIALDVYRTEWSQFLVRKADGTELNPLNSSPIAEGRLHDTTQVRLGSEYLLIRERFVVPLRGGVFYDPEPTTGGLDDFFGFSLGTGFSRGRLSLDASYQYRAGKNVGSDIPAVQESRADISQHTFLVSLIFYFR